MVQTALLEVPMASWNKPLRLPEIRTPEALLKISAPKTPPTRSRSEISRPTVTPFPSALEVMSKAFHVPHFPGHVNPQVAENNLNR
jgi:hypothetical protein